MLGTARIIDQLGDHMPTSSLPNAQSSESRRFRTNKVRIVKLRLLLVCVLRILPGKMHAWEVSGTISE